MSKPASLKTFDLGAFDVPLNPHNQVASVISIPLNDIHEDPDQPRKQFDQADLEKFSQDILRRGVQQPIAVKPLGTGIAQYQIIQGARRYRASVLAGLTQIPAIVRVDVVTFDDYSQVTENTQREDLSPLDIARFIQSRKDKGESNVYIADQLNESKDYVGKHLAILDAPEFIQEALRNGVIQGVQSTYHLTSLYKKSPDLAINLVKDYEILTQAQILSALKSVNTAALISENPGLSQIANISPEGAQAIVENASDVKIIFNDVAMESASHLDNAKTKIVAFAVSETKASKEIASATNSDEPVIKGNEASSPDNSSESHIDTELGEPSKKPTSNKQTRLAINGFIRNLDLQLGNKAAKHIVLNHSEAKTLKALLEGML